MQIRLVSTFRKTFHRSRSHLFFWGGILLILGVYFCFPLPQANSAPLSLPVDLQTPIFATRLQGGYSYRSSPVIADVLAGSPGLEIVAGTAATRPDQGGYQASVALVRSNGTVAWEKLNYTWQGVNHKVGSILGSPAVADLDNNGQMDIVVGMGGGNDPETRGGILALNGHDGSLKWYVPTKSVYDGDNIPDGIVATPSIADFDGDGKQEVVVAGHDHYLWLIDGVTGAVEPGFPISMWDTVTSSTAVADLDEDGSPDFVFGGDFTNKGASSYMTDDVPQLPHDGGVLRGMKYKNGEFYLPGWDQCISSVWPCVPAANNNNLLIPIGKWIEQTIYSSPAIGDINRDGELEIVVGSGYYWSPATVGHWVKIWRADGTLLKTLTTTGVTFASPALADLNGDDYLDIVIGDLQMGNNAQGIFNGAITGPSRLYAWSGKPSDNFKQLWSTIIGTWQAPGRPAGMFSSPVIADIDPGQPGPEILFGYDTEIVVFNGRTGAQLTYVAGGPQKPTLATFGFFRNSPAVGDINNDGKLEIVVANDNAVPIGAPRTWHQWVVAWHWPGAGNNAASADLPWPMFRRNPANHAFVPAPRLGVSPSGFGFIYQYGSGDSNPAGTFTIQNIDNPDSLNYTITYPQSMMTLGLSSTGTLGPSASLQVPFVILASNQVTGTYTLNVSVQGTSRGNPIIQSPFKIDITLSVGDIKSTYLPVLIE